MTSSRVIAGYSDGSILYWEVGRGCSFTETDSHLFQAQKSSLFGVKRVAAVPLATLRCHSKEVVALKLLNSALHSMFASASAGGFCFDMALIVARPDNHGVGH
jgi:hypothetical protein